MSHSATYTLPWPSTAMPWGLLNLPGLNRALGTNSPPKPCALTFTRPEKYSERDHQLRLTTLYGT